MRFGQRLLRVETSVSTNEALLGHEFQHEPEGVSLLALSQTSGKGRGGRVWHSPPGGMYLSVLLRPPQADGLTLLGALAVIQLLEKELGCAVGLRWPNDVLLNHRKVAGILPRAIFKGQSLERAVLGIGLNVYAPVKDYCLTLGEATSLLEEGCSVESTPEGVGRLALSLLAQLEALYFGPFAAGGARLLAELCNPYLTGVDSGEGVLVHDDGTVLKRFGPIAGLGPDGGLKFLDGGRLSALGPEERFRIHPLDDR